MLLVRTEIQYLCAFGLNKLGKRFRVCSDCSDTIVVRANKRCVDRIGIDCPFLIGKHQTSGCVCRNRLSKIVSARSRNVSTCNDDIGLSCYLEDKFARSTTILFEAPRNQHPINQLFAI